MPERFEKENPAQKKSDTGDKLLDFVIDSYVANKCGEKGVVRPAKTQQTCDQLEKSIKDYLEILKVTPV